VEFCLAAPAVGVDACLRIPICCREGGVGGVVGFGTLGQVAAVSIATGSLFCLASWMRARCVRGRNRQIVLLLRLVGRGL